MFLHEDWVLPIHPTWRGRRQKALPGSVRLLNFPLKEATAQTTICLGETRIPGGHIGRAGRHTGEACRCGVIIKITSSQEDAPRHKGRGPGPHGEEPPRRPFLGVQLGGYVYNLGGSATASGGRREGGGYLGRRWREQLRGLWTQHTKWPLVLAPGREGDSSSVTGRQHRRKTPTQP